MNNPRIGQGYDVHAITRGDGIVLGGVRIPCDFSLAAHSDGDVLIHALCDALLGALGRGDIGRMFPDDDAQNRGRDSREFLRRICELMQQDGYRLGNADVTIIAQAPRMAPWVEEMTENLARDLGCEQDRVNIKATTSEKLGAIGRGEGIAVNAIVLLEQTA